MASPTGTAAVVALKPARTYPSSNTLHCIRFSCRQGATPAGEDALPALTTAVPVHIGTVPKGSVITNIQLHVRTLFGGTPAFVIGTSGTADAFLTAAESAVATAGLKKNLGVGTLMGFQPAEVNLYAKLTATPATAGELHAVIEYYPLKT